MDSQPESVSDEELAAAMQASIDETVARRAEGVIEVMRLGRWRWKYRFYWGRHVAQGPIVAWFDYETGVRMTKNWAFVAGAWHLSKLQTKAARKWEPGDE